VFKGVSDFGKAVSCREVRELVLFDSVFVGDAWHKAEPTCHCSVNRAEPARMDDATLWFSFISWSSCFTCLTCLAEPIAIYTPKKPAFVRGYKFPRVDTFPGVNKVIEFVNMMFIWILIIKMCYSWMFFLSF